MNENPVIVTGARFWTVSQNNSGGIFDHDAERGIGYAICVEAIDVTHAKARLWEIIESYPASYDCSCCGARWSIYLDDDDGHANPSMWGDDELEGGWGLPSYIHYLDGHIEPRGELSA